jgi:hypothetical protein
LLLESMTMAYRPFATIALLSLVFGCSSESAPSSVGKEAGSDAALDAVEEPNASDDGHGDTSVTNDSNTEADVSDEPIVDGGQEAKDDADAGEEPTWPGPPWFGCTPHDKPATATLVTAFDHENQYFNPQDKRTIDAVVNFPQGAWERIDLIVELTCPEDGDCDNWDRFANLMLVDNAGTANEEVLELERYITPFNIGLCIRTDVTRLAPRLTGTKTLRSFIDTWVGPNEPIHGHGWRTTVQFVFHPGTPSSTTVPSSVVSLWPFETIDVGDPQRPVAEQAGTRTVLIPAGTKRAELRVVATGHGQGNRFNCAEFCRLEHEFTVNGTAFSFDPWRDDCSKNPIGPKQAGTWKFSRAGWCPGAYTMPTIIDITGAVQPGQEATITYDSMSPIHGEYENTCRPDAGDANNKCVGCAFDNSAGNCDFNGGSHTPPHHRLTTQLLLYP